MTTKKIVNKLVLVLQFSAVSMLMMIPINAAHAEYFLVYGGAPATYVNCISCNAGHVVKHKRQHYAHHKVHKYNKHKYTKHKYTKPCKRHSSYTMTVYYPLPAYAWAPPPCDACSSCSSCGGCCGTTRVTEYYSYPQPTNVYFVEPQDRIVGNRFDNYNYYGPVTDMGTADNDVY